MSGQLISNYYFYVEVKTNSEGCCYLAYHKYKSCSRIVIQCLLVAINAIGIKVDY